VGYATELLEAIGAGYSGLHLHSDGARWIMGVHLQPELFAKGAEIDYKSRSAHRAQKESGEFFNPYEP